MRRLDARPGRREGRGRGLDHPRDLVVDLERAAEVGATGDAEAGRGAPVSGGAKSEPGSPSAVRDARVGPGDDREQQREVADVAGQRAAHRGASPSSCRSARTAPGRATGAARRRRRTTPGCAASRPCPSRRRAAPSRRAGHTPLRRWTRRPTGWGRPGCRVVPKTVLKVCDPAANSGTLVLPIATAPARPDPLDDEVVGVGHVVGEQRRAVRRTPAGDVVGVLERERQAVQRPERVAPRRRLVGGGRARAGALLVEGDDRVELAGCARRSGPGAGRAARGR